MVSYSCGALCNILLWFHMVIVVASGCCFVWCSYNWRCDFHIVFCVIILCLLLRQVVLYVGHIIMIMRFCIVVCGAI